MAYLGRKCCTVFGLKLGYSWQFDDVWFGLLTARVKSEVVNSFIGKAFRSHRLLVSLHNRVKGFLWIMESYTCYTFRYVCDFSVPTPAVFFIYGRTKNREIPPYEMFVCSFVAVFCISCLLVVVYGGLEEGQWGAISVTRGPCPLSLQDVTSTCQCSLCWPIVKSITTYNHLYCKGAKELFHFCPYL